MAQVLPFRALRYDPDRAGGLSPILSPPYDIISPQGREELYRQSPYNVVRLEFGRPGPGDSPSDNAYTRAAALLNQWLGDAVLSREDGPAYYAVTEEYGSGAAALTRTGVYGAVRLEEYERGVILPHEQTRPGPKEDRLRLMEACRAVFSPLMSLYRDPGGLRSLLAATMQDRPPQIEAAEGAIRYRLWPIRDPGAVRQVQEAFSNAPVYLGDGHHRYETALTYRDARRAQSGPAAPEQPAYDYALMCLIDMDDPGFQLLSFHRVLHGLTQEQIDRIWDRVRSLFEVAPLGAADSLESALATLQAMDADRPTYGLVDAATGQGYTLSLRDDPPPGLIPPAQEPLLPRCETWLLHQAVLDPVIGAASAEPEEISFLHGLDEVARLLDSAQAQLVFLVRPMDLGLFESLVQRGQRLPPKTTYFSPKLPTGLVMHTLDGEL